MDEIKFDWDDIDELKVNLKKWAYNDDLILMEQDEDLLFHDIEWTEIVFPFMFDVKCSKRNSIIRNFEDFIREMFLHRKAQEIEQIQKLFIHDMVVHYSATNDRLIGDCIDYFLSCKTIFDTPQKATVEKVKHIGKLLLNGLTNVSKINEPTILANGSFQITSTSSVTCYLCVDSQTGQYKYNGYRPCE